MYDLKIKNAKIVDGTGLKSFHGDIAVIDDVIVETRKGKVSYKTNRITKDYHNVISTLIESVDEWRELWFQKKHECDALKEK